MSFGVDDASAFPEERPSDTKQKLENVCKHATWYFFSYTWYNVPRLLDLIPVKARQPNPMILPTAVVPQFAQLTPTNRYAVLVLLWISRAVRQCMLHIVRNSLSNYRRILV